MGEATMSVRSSSSSRRQSTCNNSLQDQLNIMSHAFCEDNANVRVSYKKRKVCLSKVFQLYQADFCGKSHCSRIEFLKSIETFIAGDKRIQLNRLLQSKKPIELLFRDTEEDWTANAGRFIPFEIDKLQNTTSSKHVTSDELPNNSLSNKLKRKIYGSKRSPPSRTKSCDLQRFAQGQDRHSIKRDNLQDRSDEIKNMRTKSGGNLMTLRSALYPACADYASPSSNRAPPRSRRANLRGLRSAMFGRSCRNLSDNIDEALKMLNYDDEEEPEAVLTAHMSDTIIDSL